MNKSEAVEIPLIKATNETLKGYGYLIDSYKDSDIEIITWPKQGWREIDEGTGNEGGSTEGSGGKEILSMDKTMLFNIRVIMKLMVNIFLGIHRRLEVS